MIDDVLILQNISKIASDSCAVRDRSSEIKFVLFNAFCYLELQFEKGLEFRKKDALRKMMNTLHSSNKKLQSMPGNKNFTAAHIASVRNNVELMELIVNMYKNAVNRNDACKRYLQTVSQVCYWLLKECKSEYILIPNGYKLSKIIAKEGFVLKYQKPTGLLQDKEPTFDVTEHFDFILRITIFYMF